MSRRAYLYFILTFVLGLIVGSAATIFYGWRAGFGRPRRPDAEHIVRFLKRDLNLDDAQTQKVGQIVRDDQEKMRQLMRQMQQQMDPQFDAVRVEGRDQIRKVLNPDQLAKFNRLVERMEARRKAHRGP
jgi:Spy/CpxP family protein refolding chaperone